jgi:hypothetical protein
MKKLVVLSLAVLTLSGCAAGMVKYDQIMEEKVFKKAEFDFQCEKSKLKVSKVDNGVFGVVGCHKRATYVGKDGHICWHGNTVSNLENYCQVVPDTFNSEK